MLNQVNGLNLVRLAMVALVVLSHSFTVGHYGAAPRVLGLTPGGWALAGLFSVSGYLVSGGRLRRSYPVYFWHRLMRLWPAFLVCLLAIVVLFAPAVYLTQHGTIDGYLTAENGPLRFLTMNALLEIRQFAVSGTPATNATGWIGNLWTIWYTVASYAIVGAILGIRDPRIRRIITAVAFAVLVVAYANAELLEPYLQNARMTEGLMRFLPWFVGGALVYQFKDRLRPSIPWALAAMAGVGVLAAVSSDWGLQAAAPLIAFALISVGNWLPAPRFLRQNDFAMGFFMYSFAVQVVLAKAGVPELVGNPWVFFAVCMLVTAPFAAFSWYVAERPVQRRLRDGAPVPQLATA
jgi:peptidoglycan/LPS O-acetylase OafA/YrhL